LRASIALFGWPKVAAELIEFDRVGFRFRALGDDLHSEIMGERHDRAQDNSTESAIASRLKDLRTQLEAATSECDKLKEWQRGALRHIAKLDAQVVQLQSDLAAFTADNDRLAAENKVISKQLEDLEATTPRTPPSLRSCPTSSRGSKPMPLDYRARARALIAARSQTPATAPTQPPHRSRATATSSRPSTGPQVPLEQAPSAGRTPAPATEISAVNEGALSASLAANAVRAPVEPALGDTVARSPFPAADSAVAKNLARCIEVLGYEQTARAGGPTFAGRLGYPGPRYYER
jgi:hypothetical protein